MSGTSLFLTYFVGIMELGALETSTEQGAWREDGSDVLWVEVRTKIESGLKTKF